MGRAEKVAKLEALLERVQQRASLPRAHESGQVSAARKRAPVVDIAASRTSSSTASTLPTRPAPAIVPSPVAPVASPRRTPIVSPVSPRAFPTAPSPEAIEPLAASAASVSEPDPSPVTTVAATANLPILNVPREALPTPAATVIHAQAASEKPAFRVNPEMTAPVSAEEVAAAAARMNKVPTFPDAFPVDARQAANLAASATSAAVAASTSNVSADESVEVEAVFPASTPKFDVGQPAKDVYSEDIEEPTKPLMHPPRTAPVRAAQQLEPATPLGAADVAKPRPATIPFDAYPAPRADVPPLSDPASPRAMVVPREVENQPAFLSNLRQPKEGGGGGALKWILLLVILVAAAYGAYALGFLKPLLGEAPPK